MANDNNNNNWFFLVSIAVAGAVLGAMITTGEMPKLLSFSSFTNQPQSSTQTENKLGQPTKQKSEPSPRNTTPSAPNDIPAVKPAIENKTLLKSHPYGQGKSLISFYTNCEKCPNLRLYNADEFIGTLNSYIKDNKVPACGQGKWTLDKLLPAGTYDFKVLSDGQLVWRNTVAMSADECKL